MNDANIEGYSDKGGASDRKTTDISAERDAVGDGSGGSVRLACRDLARSYGHVRALNGVSFDLHAGEILALFGDNGAGKSTLIRILAGSESPDDGWMELDGKRVLLRGPSDGRHHGIEVVWQDLALAASLDVAGNLFLGRELTTRCPLPGILRPLRKSSMSRQAVDVLQNVGLDPKLIGRRVSELSGGQRQQLAFTRTAAWARNLVLMDEPTAALSVVQRAKVWEWCKSVVANGTSIVAIGHSVDELLEVADRVLVLRHGRKVLDCRREDTNMREVVERMAGIHRPPDDDLTPGRELAEGSDHNGDAG